MKRLTDKIFWAKSWTTHGSGYTSKIKYTAVYKKLDKLFKLFLEKENKSILEIGCGGGRWLIYFAKEFGYNVWGIDYSEIGCKIARENLKREDVSGTILCEDVFKNSLESEFLVPLYFGVGTKIEKLVFQSS